MLACLHSAEKHNIIAEKHNIIITSKCFFFGNKESQFIRLFFHSTEGVNIIATQLSGRQKIFPARSFSITFTDAE